MPCGGLAPHEVDGLAQSLVSRREQTRQTEHVRPLAFDGGGNLLGRHIDAKIDHGEAIGVEQGDHHVLADVVDVAAHGGDDHLASALAAGGFQAGDEQLGRFPDDLAGHDEGRDVEGALLVEAADALHAGVALLDQRCRILTGLQPRSDLRQGGTLVHADDEFVEALALRWAHGVILLLALQCRRWS